MVSIFNGNAIIRLHILEWCVKGRTGWNGGGIFNKYTCRAATADEQLRVLKWLSKQDCPWDRRTYREVDMNGHLELLKWVRDHGCQWDHTTSSWAAKYEHFEVLKLAFENVCTYFDNIYSPTLDSLKGYASLIPNLILIPILVIIAHDLFIRLKIIFTLNALRTN